MIAICRICEEKTASRTPCHWNRCSWCNKSKYFTGDGSGPQPSHRENRVQMNGGVNIHIESTAQKEAGSYTQRCCGATQERTEWWMFHVPESRIRSRQRAADQPQMFCMHCWDVARAPADAVPINSGTVNISHSFPRVPTKDATTLAKCTATIHSSSVSRRGQTMARSSRIGLAVQHEVRVDTMRQ